MALGARKALVRVGYACNNACVFCHTLHRRPAQAGGPEVERKIRRAGELGHDMVVFSGGEPTCRPELTRWAEQANRIGLKVGLTTNGRMLAYETLARSLTRSGLRYAHVSLHGGDAATHDAIVRASAFEQTVQGIRNLVCCRVEVTVACVVVPRNLGQLQKVVDAVAGFGRVRLKFAMPEPKGLALDHIASVVPRVSEVATAVSAALEYAVRTAPQLVVAHEGIPLCLMPGWETAGDDLRRHGFVSASEVGESDFYPVDSLNREQPNRCADCGLCGPCPGVYRPYAKRYGSDELRPTRRRRSNSFNYTRVRRLAWPPGAACPVRVDGVAPYDRARHLFVREASSLVVLETQTRDFSDAEIAWVRDRGQVYVDRGKADRLEDFSVELGGLCEIVECRDCCERERCPLCYESSSRSVFEQEVAVLETCLAELEGDVLDVGCGRGRYLGALAPAAQRGAVRYLGIDPDEAALERLARRWPWAKTEVLAVEQLAGKQQFDHILLINSYNHLERPRRVVEKLTERLRPGGTLLVADDVAFGVVRSAERTCAAEAGGAGFEHFRNHGAREAHALLVDLGLSPRLLRDVTQDTANQWFIRYTRVP